MLLKTKMLVCNDALDDALNEALIDSGIVADAQWEDFTLVLGKVCGYSPIVSENGDVVKDETNVLMSDGFMTIQTPYLEFDKLMRALDK